MIYFFRQDLIRRSRCMSERTLHVSLRHGSMTLYDQKGLFFGEGSRKTTGNRCFAERSRVSRGVENGFPQKRGGIFREKVRGRWHARWALAISIHLADLGREQVSSQAFEQRREICVRGLVRAPVIPRH